MLTAHELARAERRLRATDPALRLRFLADCPRIISIERKVFCGRIGKLGPGGAMLSPDVGRRQEEGHAQVGTLPVECFELEEVRQALLAADTWRKWDVGARPLWQEAEWRDELTRSRKVNARKDGLRYRASQFFDRYVWKYKQRVSVPAQIG